MLKSSGLESSVLPMDNMSTTTLATIIIVGSTAGITGLLFFVEWIFGGSEK